jgi:hypothetical protein
MILAPDHGVILRDLARICMNELDDAWHGKHVDGLGEPRGRRVTEPQAMARGQRFDLLERS